MPSTVRYEFIHPFCLEGVSVASGLGQVCRKLPRRPQCPSICPRGPLQATWHPRAQQCPQVGREGEGRVRRERIRPCVPTWGQSHMGDACWGGGGGCPGPPQAAARPLEAQTAPGDARSTQFKLLKMHISEQLGPTGCKVRLVFPVVPSDPSDPSLLQERGRAMAWTGLGQPLLFPPPQSLYKPIVLCREKPAALLCSRIVG